MPGTQGSVFILHVSHAHTKKFDEKRSFFHHKLEEHMLQNTGSQGRQLSDIPETSIYRKSTEIRFTLPKYEVPVVRAVQGGMGLA